MTEINMTELQKEIEKIISARNKEYNESFNNARKTTAKFVLEKYITEHPTASEEEIKEYVADYLAQTPDEFQRNLRGYVNTSGTLFNLLVQLNNNVEEFKTLFLLLHQDEIQAKAIEELNKQDKNDTSED